MEKLFRTIRQLIADKQFDELARLDIEKPEYFNWVKEIFEGIHVKDTPDTHALLWTDGKQTIPYSFAEMNRQTNRLLNFLRNKNIVQQDVILTQMALQPVNWFGILATIKGGFRMVPAATILGLQDIVYRFRTLMPKVVIADTDNAAKIEAAEQQLGTKVAVKIIAEGTREGWYSIEEVMREQAEAEAAVTKADDPLFLFFTSGTTGMPKVVTHTHLSYPFGHLSTASWIGLRRWGP